MVKACDENGVTFEGIPFKQTNTASQIRVSLAMAMALNPGLRVIRIAETLSASAETRGIDLKRRKSNYLSLSFSAWDAVFCSLLAVSVAAGLIL